MDVLSQSCDPFVSIGGPGCDDEAVQRIAKYIFLGFHSVAGKAYAEAQILSAWIGVGYVALFYANRAEITGPMRTLMVTRTSYQFLALVRGALTFYSSGSVEVLKAAYLYLIAVHLGASLANCIEVAGEFVGALPDYMFEERRAAGLVNFLKSRMRRRCAIVLGIVGTATPAVVAAAASTRVDMYRALALVPYLLATITFALSVVSLVILSLIRTLARTTKHAGVEQKSRLDEQRSGGVQLRSHGVKSGGTPDPVEAQQVQYAKAARKLEMVTATLSQLCVSFLLFGLLCVYYAVAFYRVAFGSPGWRVPVWAFFDVAHPFIHWVTFVLLVGKARTGSFWTVLT